ncbi:MAG: protease inhibitor I42 family protein [Pyrinomonadaceae bacterium]
MLSRITREFSALVILFGISAMFYVVAGGSAAAALSGAYAGDKVTVTEKEAGGKVCLSKGDVLAVRLEAQLGTGYGWQVVKYRSQQLELLGEPEQETPDKGAPGAIEHQIFRFKAQSSGSTALELQYVRPWEKNAKPLKTYRVEVVVE